ncbi:hypothetical protein XENTR_v10000007 [Xenopus tropicalis]|nr:hypothetical protein XENTR_v10000007 [Xenopus tropicalis]
MELSLEPALAAASLNVHPIVLFQMVPASLAQWPNMPIWVCYTTWMINTRGYETYKKWEADIYTIQSNQPALTLT